MDKTPWLSNAKCMFLFQIFESVIETSMLCAAQIQPKLSRKKKRIEKSGRDDRGSRLNRNCIKFAFFLIRKKQCDN